MQRFASKVVLVTGGAAGLGEAIAARLAAEGASVVISDVDPRTGRASAAMNGFTFVEHDVRDEAGWLAVIAKVEAQFGRLDVLVNNAGILGNKEQSNPENSGLDDWRHVFAINVEGVFLGCRTAIPVMRKGGGGAIVNIASVAGLLATPYATAYGASKAAVRQLTKSVAQHCAEQGLPIRCNAIQPGNVHTALWQREAEEKAGALGISVEAVLEEAQAMVPMGDFTRAEDVAAAVAYLASDEARHVTGTDLVVDGGATGCDSFHLVPGAKYRVAQRKGLQSTGGGHDR